MGGLRRRGPPGRRGARRPRGRARAGRLHPRGQPAGVGHLRRRGHGRRSRPGRDLHDLLAGGVRLHPQPLRGPRPPGRERGAAAEDRDLPGRAAPPAPRRDDAGRAGRRRPDGPRLGGVHGPGRGERGRLRRAAGRPAHRRRGDLHLHLGHDRTAQGGDAHPRQPELDVGPGGRPGRRRPVRPAAVVPAAVAHRRADVHHPHRRRGRHARVLRRVARQAAGEPRSR